MKTKLSRKIWRVLCIMIIFAFIGGGFIEMAVAAEQTNAAMKTSQNSSQLYLKPKEISLYSVQFKNTGTNTWLKEKTYLKSSTTAFKFQDSSWTSAPYLAATLSEDSVAPGQTGTFNFTLKAPSILGQYTGEFFIINNFVMIQGSEFSVKMRVVENPAEFVAAEPVAVIAPLEAPITAAPMCKLNLRVANAVEGDEQLTCVMKFGFPTNGPTIRVGLFYDEPVISLKNNQVWEIYDADDNHLAFVPANAQVDLRYIRSINQYVVDLVDRTIRSNSYIKLKNPNNGIFELPNREDRAKWNLAINYNKYRGALEYRHTEATDRVWLINSLPMEDYLKGLIETSNYDPEEYLKTMVVAARTYAMYQHNLGTKHAKEFFDVDAYWDQVYKGSVVESVLPNMAKAVNSTRGIVSTYNDELIIAAYFSRGDGRTRSYKEVWKRDIPYLISVPTEFSKGLTMSGHGVGIDAYDAKQRAKTGLSFAELLKYYYRGSELETIY